MDGWKKFLNAFKKSGYSISVAGLRSSRFGVPQDRHRLFVAGFMNRSSFDISQVEGPSDSPTVKDAILGLPPLPECGGGEQVINHPRICFSSFSQKLMGKSKRLYNHWCTKHSQVVVETIRCIKEGRSLRKMWPDLPESVKSRYTNSDALHDNTYRRLSWNNKKKKRRTSIQTKILRKSTKYQRHPTYDGG